jgi:hypothetical protein
VIFSHNSQEGFAEILLHKGISNSITKTSRLLFKSIMNYGITWCHHMVHFGLERIGHSCRLAFVGCASSSLSLKDNSILRKLIQWTADIHGHFVPDGEMSVPFTSSTHTDMREQLRLFRMRARNARFKGKAIAFSPWPFVEIIR